MEFHWPTAIIVGVIIAVAVFIRSVRAERARKEREARENAHSGDDQKN